MASQGASPARCAQAECIASRNELALCKRDLDELEREHDQLHEQLARKEGECAELTRRAQQSESALALASQQWEQRLAASDAEIARLQAVVKGLSAADRQQQQQQQQQSRQDPDGNAAGDVGALEAKLRAENDALTAMVTELRAAIARETSASAHANQQVAKIQQESKDKRDELYQALKENEMLRRERQERDDALEKVSQLALDYETALKVLHDQQRDYLEAIDEMRIDNSQQRVRIEQLEREKEAVEAKLIEMDEHESEIDSVVHELKMKHDMEKAVLRAELDELRKKATEWKQKEKQRQDHVLLGSNPGTTGRGTNSGEQDIEELERQLELVHELRVQDKLKLDEKEQEIQQLRSDVESLVEHLHSTGSETQQAVQRALQTESRKHQATDQDNVTLKRRLKEQGSLIEQLEFRQAQLEKDLVEAQEWNAKYEAGAGLEDVMRYQKKLRRELEKQQVANQKLRQELNDQRDATGKLHLAFDRLKSEAGKDADFEYDDLAIENHLKGELAVHKAVMTQLEHQLHELENERVRLLQKLRDQARVVGGKLYETHGLTTDQWQQVEEFIDRVKLTPEVAKRWLNHLDTAEASVIKAVSETSVGAEERDELRRLRQENSRLRDELKEAVEIASVVESRSALEEHKPNESTSLKDKKSVATSPLKQQQGRHEASAPRNATSSSSAGDDRDEEAPRRGGSDQRSAESLAQAIASALESRLQLIHDSTVKATHVVSCSVATQPSPAKSSAMDNSRLAFETENELSQQADFLREFQLLLDDYVKLEGQNESLRDQLSHQETTCKSLMDQQNVVYQHFFHLQDASTTEKAKLQFDVQQLKAQNQELHLKCQRYEATLYTLESSAARDGEDGMLRLRAEVVELARRVAHDEVSFTKLKREHQLLQEEYRLSLSDAQGIEHDWLEMERVLKFRILYLESWKSGAEELMARTEATLDKCVLKSVADRKHSDLELLLEKHTRLCEEYAELHAQYLKVYELPTQMSKLVHENAMLVAERAARQGDKFVSVDDVLQRRITQLQDELDKQVEHVKNLEGKMHSLVVVSSGSHSESAESSGDRDKLLESENSILCERISEVEQLYESLVRVHEKAKKDAELAANQAHTLSQKMTQEKAKLADKEDQLRDLMAATEDHAIVARLQQQLIHMKSNYQQFLLKYDSAIADQQQASLMRQHAELALENQAKTLSEAQEKARGQILVLEASLQELKERDYVMRNSKWDAFKKRLDGLEEEMRAEQDRRRALEKELEEKQATLPFGGNLSSTSVTSAAEASRLKARIDSLETRERVLMGQLDVLAKNASSRGSSRESDEENRLRKEVGELKRVHGEMIRQLQSLQARNAELLQLNNDLETQKRNVQRQKDDLEIDYQQLHAQWQLQGGRGNGGNNQVDAHSSPIMRKKVGLYEKDHLEQQQAAQASIASLKQLLTEKNAVIAEYQKKITTLRADAAAGKAQERADATQLHKKLYEDNQRMIAQLKEATDKIYHLEKTGGDKKALKAAQDRHEYVLQEWKRVEIELEAAKSRLRELELEVQSLTNERDIAEARAGEALEEIVLNQEKIVDLEKAKKVVEDQLLHVKRDALKREERMQLLREAIIKLKEEFLKAEDRHAIEIAKAQNVVRSTKQSKNETERERDEWNEQKEQLEAQVQMLQEKLVLAKKSEEKSKSELSKVSKQQQQNLKSMKVMRGEEDNQGRKVDANEPTNRVSILEAEIERLKGALKDKVVGEVRLVEELEKKIKVLQAQNLALRESSGSPPNSSVTVARGGDGVPGDGLARQIGREQWEGEKRLQRRVDVVTMRLKEKQVALEKSEKECDRLRERLNQSESKLRELQRMASSAREAIQGNTDTSAGEAPGTSRGQKAPPDGGDLERQNSFLQETLVLKRKEWEQSFQEQMENYETQLQRLRSRLAQRHHGDQGNLTHLEREERDFVTAHDVQEELQSMGNEMRNKERQLVEKDTRLMELELELESLRIEYQRQHRKATSAKTSNVTPTPTATGRRIKSSAQERLELEEVIENMKKVIEKLRSENEKLRKAAAAVVSPDKVDAMRRKLKEARDARQGLQVEVDQLRLENSELKRDKLRLQQRVRLLSSSAPRSSGARDDSNRKSADDDTERLHQLQLAEKDAQISDLESRIAKKDTYIRELNERLAHDERREANASTARDVEKRCEVLRSQVEALSLENDHLRHELSAFDQDFFEEIEDLKYKYSQAIRDKQRLERLINGSST